MNTFIFVSPRSSKTINTATSSSSGAKPYVKDFCQLLFWWYVSLYSISCCMEKFFRCHWCIFIHPAVTKEFPLTDPPLLLDYCNTLMYSSFRSRHSTFLLSIMTYWLVFNCVPWQKKRRCNNCVRAKKKNRSSNYVPCKNRKMWQLRPSRKKSRCKDCVRRKSNLTSLLIQWNLKKLLDYQTFFIFPVNSILHSVSVEQVYCRVNSQIHKFLGCQTHCFAKAYHCGLAASGCI